MQPFHSEPETREWGEVTSTQNLSLPVASSSFSPCPLSLSPQLQSMQWAQLSRRQQQLQVTIQDAKTEQAMMLQLFQSLGRLESGGSKKLKKCRRRCPEEIVERHHCPHQNCTRFYSSDSALKRHVRLKHDQLGDDPPEKYHTLHPEPELQSQPYFSAEESQQQQAQKQKTPPPATYHPIQVKCK